MFLRIPRDWWWKETKEKLWHKTEGFTTQVSKGARLRWRGRGGEPESTAYKTKLPWGSFGAVSLDTLGQRSLYKHASESSRSRSWRASLAIKSMYYSCRRSEFDCQHPNKVAHHPPIINSSSRGSDASDLYRHVHRPLYRTTHIGITFLNKFLKITQELMKKSGSWFPLLSLQVWSVIWESGFWEGMTDASVT